METKKFIVPLILILAGALMGLGSFLFALGNMAYGIWSLANGNIESFILMFVLHLVAMAGMAIGGFVSTIGFYFGGWRLLKAFLDSNKVVK